MELKQTKRLLLSFLLVFGLIGCHGEDKKTVPEQMPPEQTSPEQTPPELTESASPPCPAPRKAGSGRNHAGLVVTYDQEIQAICVAFEEDSITAFELVRRSGLPLASQYFQNPSGETICKISSEGCDYPREPCFCQQGLFWSFWVVDNSSHWTSSKLGVSAATVSHGQAQAQVWGGGETPPPSCFFEDICSQS